MSHRSSQRSVSPRFTLSDAQRLQLPKIRYLNQKEEFHNVLEDSTMRVKGIELLNNNNQPESDVILVNYKEKQEFVEDSFFGNVVLAAFTTAYARLHLYETLERLDSRILFFYTNSIVNSLGGLTGIESSNSCPEGQKITTKH